MNDVSIKLSFFNWKRKHYVSNLCDLAGNFAGADQIFAGFFLWPFKQRATLWAGLRIAGRGAGFIEEQHGRVYQRCDWTCCTLACAGTPGGSEDGKRAASAHVAGKRFPLKDRRQF